MEPWVFWTIIGAVGLVVGFIVHALLRFSQGGSIFLPLLAGIVGALLAVYFFSPYVPAPTAAGSSALGVPITWAIVGSLVLSFIVELLFVPTRRGQVVTG